MLTCYKPGKTNRSAILKVRPNCLQANGQTTEGRDSRIGALPVIWNGLSIDPQPAILPGRVRMLKGWPNVNWRKQYIPMLKESPPCLPVYLAARNPDDVVKGARLAPLRSDNRKVITGGAQIR